MIFFLFFNSSNWVYGFIRLCCRRGIFVEFFILFLIVSRGGVSKGMFGVVRKYLDFFG